MPHALKRFQQEVCDGLALQFAQVRQRYDELGPEAPERERDLIRHRDAAVMLQAPTGSGKTLLAVETMARLSGPDNGGERLLWFWFAPFAGVVEQARRVLRDQAPQLRLLDLDSDRRMDALQPGAVFVTTWQSVAAANKDARRARSKSDAAVSIDALIAQARAAGYRIACVVDEAHHGFQSAKEAKRFFAEVLKPDYALLMTATPDDEDARRFAKDTGYQLGGSERLASLSRADGVEAGLLKRGVKLVRFIARNDDETALIDFEHTALDECVRLHRQVKAELAAQAVPLTPLMLVQVPDDKSHRRAKGAPGQIEQVRARLVEQWGFAKGAVRVHSSDEPDPDLIALVADPSVEVLVFKMAVALGFDAPRAFTLCALRGVRDQNFGVQVVGRLMRVHPLLQGRGDLPRELDFGYVFLANYESQEGLLDAGKLINAIETQAPELGTQTVVTVIAGEPQVQVVRPNEAPVLFRRSDGTATRTDATTPDSGSEDTPADHDPQAATGDFGDALPLFGGTAPSPVPAATAGTDGSGTDGADGRSALGHALRADARRVVTAKRLPLVPARLVTEALPEPEADIEERLAALVDFSAQVLASQQGEWAEVERRSRDMFDGRHVSESRDEDSVILAQLDAAAVARRVDRQLGLFGEVQPNRLMQALSERFGDALRRNNIRPPDDPEELDRRLDLVLAHHPQLLRAAFKRARLDALHTREVELPAVAGFDAAGIEARRNAYGRFPEDLNNDEREFAKLLDAEAGVRWWHRNPVRQASSVALFGWDHGAGFYPDFVVGVDGRQSRDGIVLVEIKGPLLWGETQEVAKIAGGRHPEYGETVAIGRRAGERFKRLAVDGERLTPVGDFDFAQLRLAGT